MAKTLDLCTESSVSRRGHLKIMRMGGRRRKGKGKKNSGSLRLTTG